MKRKGILSVVALMLVAVLLTACGGGGGTGTTTKEKEYITQAELIAAYSDVDSITAIHIVHICRQAIQCEQCGWRL